MWIERKLFGACWLISSLFIALISNPLAASPPVPKLEELALGTEFTWHQFPIDGGHVACAHRPGNGATIVLIPGTFGDAGVFAAISKYLDKSLNLIVIETRGIGHSWPPPARGSIEQCARDTIMILD